MSFRHIRRSKTPGGSNALSNKHHLSHGQQPLKSKSSTSNVGLFLTELDPEQNESLNRPRTSATTIMATENRKVEDISVRELLGICDTNQDPFSTAETDAMLKEMDEACYSCVHTRQPLVRTTACRYHLPTSGLPGATWRFYNFSQPMTLHKMADSKKPAIKKRVKPRSRKCSESKAGESADEAKAEEEKPENFD